MESTGGDVCRNTSSLLVADTSKDDLNPLQVVASTGDAGGDTIAPSGNEEAPEKENADKESMEGNDCTDLEAVSKEGAADSSSEKTTAGNVSECSDHKKSDNGTITVVSGENASEDVIPSEDRRSTQASGFIQILALLRKNLLTKYRSPTATFFELFSPVLMTLVLAAAYTVTEITYKDAQMYSEMSVDVPGPWLDLIQRSTDLFTATEDAGSGSRRKLRREPNSMEFQIEDKGDPVGWTGMFDALQEKIHRKMVGHVVAESRAHNRKLFHRDDNGGGKDDGEDDFAEVFKLLDEANKEISSLLQSPIPVPSFDQYVETSSALSTLIGVDNLPRVFSDSSFGRQWGNLLTLGTIHLSPNNDVTKSFWSYLNETYPILLDSVVKVQIHDDEKDALRFINDNLDQRTWALLDFSRYSVAEEENRFKIRMNYTTVPNTNEITNYVSIGLNKGYQMYYLSGYLTLQRTINEFAFARSPDCSEAQDTISSLWSMPMPTAAYSQNPFFLQVGYLLGLTMVMAYLYPVSRLIKTMVEEKESRMKETLFILGLRGWAHWFSWIFTSLCVFFIITLTVTASLTATVLQYSDPAYIFLYVGLFSTAIMGFCFTLAALFSRAKLAAIIGPVALFVTLLPRFIFFGTNRYEATVGKTIASLLPATAFTFGADIIADYEYSQQGIQSWNAGEGDYSFNTTLGLLFFDTLLYTFLGWYLDQVIPRQYGVARPFYFLLTPSYWCSFLFSRRSKSSASDYASSPAESSPDIELVTDATLVPRVQISNLVKRYHRSSAYPSAVDNLNLTMYESQITALLGHNGAGKTTAVSVLTGLFPPTSGDCIIYGRSIVDDLQEARQSIGICPQHNVLFDCLTVSEHLAFFMRIKGIRPDSAKVRDHAEEIGLTEYISTTSSALSGGNKRKLSVAIALSGDPSVLVLDEPTSAMDPHSRRAVWELLRAKRKGRVTLLTTHFMDEAELLSDRIAVMKEGKLQCCGSALFLKARFGLGYNLTVVLEPSESASDEEAGYQNLLEVKPKESSFFSQRDRLAEFLRERIPNTQLVRTSGKEVTFRFPQGTESLFPAAFDALEVERNSLGVGAYGIQNSSLEEVFLQLADVEDAGSSDEHKKDPQGEHTQTDAEPVHPIEETGEVTQVKYGHLSPLHQIGLLYTKRFIIQKRDMKGAFCTIILPVLVVALVLLILMVEPPFVGPGIELNPSLYKTSSVGGDSETGIVVGGVSPVTSTLSVEEEFLRFSESVQQQYEYTDFIFDENATTSADVSRYLLDTYNHHDHPPRFGAFALNDVIKMAIRTSWDDIRESLKSISGPSGDYNQTSLDLLKTFSLGDSDGKIRWNVSVGEIADRIYDSTLLSPRSSFDAVQLQALTKKALDQIFASRSNSNSSASLDEWYQALDEFVRDIVDEMIVETGSANLTGLADLETELVDFVLDSFGVNNATEENFLQWSNEWLSRLQDQLNSTSGSLYELRVWSQDILDALNNSNLTDGEWQDWTLELLDNVTRVVEDTIDDSSLEDTGLNLTNFMERTDSFLEESGAFEREPFLQSFVELVDGFVDYVDLDTALNASKFVSQAFEFLDNASIRLGDSLQPIEMSNTLALFSIAFADSSLRQLTGLYGQNTTLDLDLVFQYFSAALGGSTGILDGLFTMEVSSATLKLMPLSLSVSGVRLLRANEVIFELENATWDLTMDDMLSLLPDGTAEYTVLLDSKASILHNSSSPHAVAAFNQAYTDYLYATCTRNATARLVSVNEPLPLTTQQSIEVQTILSILAALFLLIPYCYIPGAFIVFLVKERISKSKHLQLVSGVNMTSYWIATYLWDLSLFFLLTICVMAVFLMYGTESAKVFVGDVESFFATMILTFGYGISILPFSYLLSRNFDNPNTAQISVVGLVFISGFVAVNAYFIMTQIETTQDAAESLRPLFRLWPAYNIGEGFIELASAFLEREVLFSDKQPLDWGVTGKSIALLYGLGPVYFLILLFLEYSDDGGSGGVVGRVLRYLRGSYDRMMLRWYGVEKVNGQLCLNDGLAEAAVNEDIKTEEEFVKGDANLHMSAPVVMRDLWKIYPPSVGVLGGLLASFKWFICCCRPNRPNQEGNDERVLPRRAVRGLTAAVQKGETFGLLGSNGAGKTTTLGVLTGDIAPTSGEAYVGGHDITGVVPGGVAQARKNIGFCPQTDPLLDLMTGRETLRMFAKLRGVPHDRIDNVVTDLLDRLTLTPHADKTSESYSGGNKRKLSLGIAALVGDGGVLLIDECSSGLDPLARKKLWGLIEQLAENRSVIITTHSMEEAEALCSRIGIMARGQFAALGSVQHLKTKYLDGYTIDINCRSNIPEDVIDIVVADVLETVVPGSKLAERHGRFLKFDVSRVSTIGLGTTFARLQKLKESGDSVENYSISQCSLEQVFLKLVKDAETPQKEASEEEIETPEEEASEEEITPEEKASEEASEEEIVFGSDY